MGVSFLLDSHAFYWLADASRAVPPHVRSALSDNVLCVSAVSAYELFTKHRLGKFDAPRLLEAWDEVMQELGAQHLDLTTAHARAAGSLDWEHRDPFDRLLVAQARVESLTLVTADRVVQRAPGIEVLAW